MKVIVNKDLCVGCGACASICPEIFDLNDEGFAYVKNENEEIKEEYQDCVREAIENCPTNAIEEK